MANSATALTQIPGPEGLIYPVAVVLDTTASDLTVFDPGAGKLAILVGLMYVNALAHKLTIKSNATTLYACEFGANSGIYSPLDTVKLAHSNVVGDVIKMRVDTNPLTVTALAYFIKSSHLRLGKV